MYSVLYIVICNGRISLVMQRFWSKQYYEMVSWNTTVPHSISRMLLYQMEPIVIPPGLRAASHIRKTSAE